MKKNTKSILAMLSLALFLGSCSATYPGMVTTNKGSKSGIASRKIYFGISFGTTDISMLKAAKDGGITKIATVETCVKKGLFVTKYVTKVTGE
jgi:hypothetical protein